MNDNYLIPENKIEEGIQFCINRSKELISDAKLLAEQGNISHALGLYTFAIEEYGKSLLILEQTEKDGGNIIIPTWIFGGKSKKRANSHIKKIEKALEKLPHECQMITLWEETIHTPTNEKREVEIEGEDDRVIIQTDLGTGTFSMGTDPDFEERLKTFYVDWNDEKKKWVVPHKPIKDSFIKSISDFLEFVDDPIQFKKSRAFSCEK